MKLYYIIYMDQECGRLKAFTNKGKATAMHNKINRIHNKESKKIREDQDYSEDDMIITQPSPKVFEADINISAEGLIEAIELGSEMVWK